MIITISEDITFTNDPSLYILNALTASADNALINMTNFDVDKVYICTNISTTGTLSFTAGSINVVGSGTSFNSTYIGRTLHITDGANKGVYVIVDTTSGTNLKVIRTVKTDSSENDVLSTQSGITTFKIATWEEYMDGSAIRDEYRSSNSIFRTSYLGKDFDTYRDEALSFVKKNFGTKFNNFVLSDMGIMLIEAFAYELEGLTWYIDYIANELSMADAKLHESISKNSRYLGYKPRPVSSSSTEIEIVLTQGYAAPVIIEAGRQLTTPNKIIFETDAEVNFGTDSTTGQIMTVSVTQGEVSQDAFVASGDVWQEFGMTGVPKGKFLVNGSVGITVNGVPWAEVEFFEFTNTQDFEVDYMANPPKIRFGNGIAGQIPIKGAQIIVTKRVGVGAKGNVASDSITKFVVPVKTDNVVIKLTVTNSVEATGGADVEDIESIRVNAPNAFLTSDKAVTQKDWDTLATTFSDVNYGQVAQAKAIISRGLVPGSVLSLLIDSIVADVATIKLMFSTFSAGIVSQTISVNTVIDGYVEIIDSVAANINDAIIRNNAIRDLVARLKSDVKGVYTVD